jgi:hypothetical protein
MSTQHSERLFQWPLRRILQRYGSRAPYHDEGLANHKILLERLLEERTLGVSSKAPPRVADGMINECSGNSMGCLFALGTGAKSIYAKPWCQELRFDLGESPDIGRSQGELSTD